MDTKLEQIQKDVTEIRVLLERNTVTLEQNTKDVAEHIRRTNLLEEHQIALARRLDMFPWKLLKWVVGGLFTAAGVIFTIIQVLQTAGLVK
jgi:hypothetical protein